MFGVEEKLPPLDSGRSGRRRRRWVWAPALALAGLLGVGSYRYGQPLWQHNDLLAKAPGLEKSLAGLGQRMSDAEQKLLQWTGDWEGMKDRVDKLEGRIQLTRRQAQEQAQKMMARVEAEMGRRNQAVETRLGGLEAEREADRARAARVQEQVAALERQAQAQDQRIVALQEQTGQDRGNFEQRVAGLDQQMNRNRLDLDGVAAQVERRRVDFEVARNHSRELAPGISLGLTKTNLAYRRYDGWLWLMPDRKTVWIRSQSAHRPVVFYSKVDGRPRELMITHVTKDSAVGYLLVPARPAGQGLTETAQLAPEGAGR